MAAERQFCTFLLGPHYFGVDVMKVQEILSGLPMTRVPLAPPVVRGLINLRGQIVTALDLRRRLQMPDLPPERVPINVIVNTNDGAVSLLVDDVSDVLTVADADFEPPPAALRGVARELVQGAYKLESRLLLILDADRAVKIEPSYNPANPSPSK
jgi:purine-binding chemotaxis protein CheW